MSDSAENNLRKLGKRVRHGMEKLRPVTQKQLADVRKAVEQQWQQQQKNQVKAPTQESTAPQKKQKSQEKSQPKQSSQDKSNSQDHGHSH